MRKKNKPLIQFVQVFCFPSKLSDIEIRKQKILLDRQELLLICSMLLLEASYAWKTLFLAIVLSLWCHYLSILVILQVN